MQRDAIIYVRISRDRIGAGLGVERQRADCENLAQRLGWNVVAVYDDNDMSAYSGKPRPGYRRMLEDLKAGAATAVLAWHTDRLHRSPTELEEYIKVMERHGVETQTVKAGQIDLSTPTGLLIARTLGNFARFEVDHMSERQQAKKVQKAGAGQWLGGRRPFGYEADGVTIRPSEAAELESKTDELLAGVSVNAVVRDWNTRGVTTTTGGKWTGNAVRRVLLRPRNAGLMEHRGEVVGSAEWPAVVEETKWRALVALLNDPSRRTSPGPQRRWLGSGLYECGVCGEAAERSTVVAATAGMGKGENRTTVPSYRCSKTRGHIARNPFHLDRYVSMVAVEWLSRPGAVEALEGPRDDKAARARILERETLRLRDEEAAEMYAAGQMTRAQLVKANETTALRRAELNQADAAAARSTALAPFRQGAPAQAVWDGLDLDRKRAVVAEIMRVIILPSKLGRPDGWTPERGATWGYFDPKFVRIEWKVSG
ncbi:recombinase family protein [Nonomuraea deserti]|nr:recombinase family protein [Nonomuraea deserti]